ncbi:SRPBCC family protein [Gulosibacter sp. 10]|uniref:SRPBCC family protein n=1 Tax=Gulosibacter sp. 10 TaxID=1255570 RepID=UPI00097F43AF|nr:SRPBCC family protein [Gulosibacter sp. 10]SJM71232.1 hypothetical protein FM112_15980 [Gulosibacter sp. 10]
MSKMTRIVSTSHTLSVTALEEASRQGLRDADIEHLFLALLLSEQSAGHALRSLGITLDAARAAIREQRSAQLGQLGIDASLPDAQRIVSPHETSGYEWKQRAADLIGRAAGKHADGSASSVLRELVVEPSGTIGDLLSHLGTSPEAVLGALDRAEAEAPDPSSRERRSRIPVHETFVPASPEETWAFLAEPLNIPSWDPNVDSVEPAKDGTWLGHAPTERPDGKPLRVKPHFRRKRFERVVAREPEHLAWRTAYPDAPRSRPVITNFMLSPATGGTRVTIGMAWLRRPGWRRLVGLPLRPFQRYLVWMTLVQIGSSASRRFR